MKIRNLILPLCVLVACHALAVDRERPNIVFFLIDDCSTHEFGCYGNKGNLTPNIDRLAEGGIRFNSAWATPLCMSSRALLLSGQYGFKTGVYDNGVLPEKRGDLPNTITPLSLTLQQAGYATFMGGKWHLKGVPGDAAWGFDEHCLYGSMCQAASKNPAFIARYTGPWWPPISPNRHVLSRLEGRGNPYATWHPLMVRNSEFVETGPDDFGPDILSRDVGDFIRRKAREKKTFFVYYAEHLTHAPHTSMRDPDDLKGETEPGMESNVRYVDLLIGRLVETLKEAGVWENTVLMVAGDNPSPTLGKGFAAAIGAHVPLIIAGGKNWVTWQGETGCLTDFADVYPTCMELAGLDPATNPELSGRSFKPLLDDHKGHTRPWIFSYLGIYRMVRDRQWCLDGLDQLWRCNDSGNPFTFELIPKDKEDAEAARGRAALQAILKELPPGPDRVIAAAPKAAAYREANGAGRLLPQQGFQQLYRIGVERLLANPARKDGPTRSQIDARSTQPLPASPDKSASKTGQQSDLAAETGAPTNMVFISPGKFLMGSPTNEVDRYPDESPQTSVTISRGFWMGKYEVTQAEYLAVMGSNPSHFTGDTNRPVDSVTWSDATNYCAKLTERERAVGRIAADVAYRLPTEAEWEYACRAGTTTRFFYGDDPDYSQLGDYAWYRQNSSFTTHPVGQKKPNPWGLYDMYGNAWEWCQDWYGAYPGGKAIDPQGPAKAGMNQQRTIRGTDYFNPAQHCRSALRGYDFVPKHPWPPDFGFRVVLAAAPPQAEDRPAQSPTMQRQPKADTAGGQRNRRPGAGTVQERFNQMAEKLGLSEEQKTRLMDLQRAQYQQMSGQSDLTPAQRMQQFKKFRAELEQKVRESKILTDEQFAKWKEFQSQRFSGGGNAGRAGPMPKRAKPTPETPAQPEAQKPKPASDASAQASLRPFESNAEPIPQGRIDELVFGRLEQLGIKPARACSDEVFLRRAYLDVIGTLPTAQEAKNFLEDDSPDKRRVLIDRLLERGEFVDYWAMNWCDLLRVKSEFPINLWPNAVQAYHRWIRTCLKENVPYDRFVRELLTASGSNFRKPQVNFYRAIQSRQPQAVGQAVALTFMGVRTEKWPEDRLAGMAAFFSQVKYKPTKEWKEEIVLFDVEKAESQAGAKTLQTAVFPDGTPARLSPDEDPREVFADWLITPENPWFARNIANRVWSWLLGRGIIHEPDDIRPDNPPSNPELLTFLEQELVAAGYELKHLYRLILNSQTYQLSHMPRSEGPDAEVNFAAYPLRRLEAEVLIDALCQITGTTEQYSSRIPEPFTFIPEDRRSIALADASITSPFLEEFGRSPRDTGLESERISRPTAAQQLHLLNSSHIRQKIEQGPILQALLRSSNRDVVTELYLTILSRYPTEEDLKIVETHTQGGFGSGRNRALLDLAWALINSPEFSYRH